MCVCEKNESKTRCHSVFETIEFVFTEFSSLVSPIIGKICKKELNFKEKQKCNMRDWVIFIILFSFPLSLRMCVTLPPARASKKLFQRNPPLHPKISGIFEYLTGGRMTRSKHFSDYHLWFSEGLKPDWFALSKLLLSRKSKIKLKANFPKSFPHSRRGDNGL